MRKCEDNCEIVHDDFHLTVKLTFNHNHAVISNDNFFSQEVTTEAKNNILSLFASGKGPSKARAIFQSELKLELGILVYLKIAADRSKNPFNLYANYCYETFGSINGPDATKKAFAIVENYNKEADKKLATIKLSNKNQMIVAILDDMSSRVHELLPQAGDIVFVDGTGSLDGLDTQMFKLMTCSPAGGLPLGFLLLGSKDEETLTEGFSELKLLLPNNAFFKRGKDGPLIFMTDDDTAEINALSKVRRIFNKILILFSPS